MPTQTDRIPILVDHREEPSGIPNLLRADAECDVTSAQLLVGDYQCAPGLVIEMKEATGDFAASIIDRRLFTQIKAAKDQGIKQIFLLYGDPYRPRRDVHENAIIGAISYIATIEECPVIQVNTKAQAASMIKTCIRHALFGLGYTISMMPPKPKTLREQQMFLLCAIPGVGQSKAEALLAHFGSPAAVFGATAAQLVAVEGIGPKLAAGIRDTLMASA